MLALKRGIDVVLGLALLLAVLPLLAVLAIAVWVETGAPVLFRCQRYGRGGRPFTMYKFRTMALGAERALQTLRSRNVAQGMVKIADDPRVTTLGRLFRRFSLDELPQLWNVVRGEMSLVGPRPHELGEVSLEDPVHLQRLRMRPGLTGLWQIRARTDPSLAIRVRYDPEYTVKTSFPKSREATGRVVKPRASSAASMARHSPSVDSTMSASPVGRRAPLSPLAKRSMTSV